jgi:cytochrome bd-type quinol oxidase subunit 2
MLKKSEKFKQIFLLFIIVVLLVLPYFVFAADLKGSLQALGEASGYKTTEVSETSLAGVIGMIVSAFLGILGVIFVILIVIAGNKWMTAMGEEEKVREAKDTIRRAIIGLIIVVGAYAIWAYVSYKLIL